MRPLHATYILYHDDLVTKFFIIYITITAYSLRESFLLYRASFLINKCKILRQNSATCQSVMIRYTCKSIDICEESSFIKTCATQSIHESGGKLRVSLPMQTSDYTVLITGGSSRIGLAFAERFLDA